MRLTTWLSAWLCAASLAAGELPPLVLPAGVGVNIHFTRDHARDLDLIAAAGFKFVRMDFGWSGVERSRDTYDWSAYDDLTANLERRGLRAIYILDYSNPLYETEVVSRNPLTHAEQRDTASPRHPESVAAFARWAAAAARHFRGHRIIWEVWNEPNISFWKPAPDVRQYRTLALATCRALREADPTATIIGPASSTFPLEFLTGFFEAGVLQYLDAVSVHPYRPYRKPPETVLEDYRKLRALLRRYLPAGKRPMPIISGEWGYASHNRGVSPETQAAFLVRQQLVNLLAGVPLSIWYDWKNDGPDPAEGEHNFGTVTADLQPKPAYRAVQVLVRELAGYHVARQLATGSKEDYVVVCADRTGAEKLAVWTTGSPHRVTLAARFKRHWLVNLHTGTGQRFTASQEGAEGHGVAPAASPAPLQLTPAGVVLELTPMPGFVALRGVRLRTPALKPGPG